MPQLLGAGPAETSQLPLVASTPSPCILEPRNHLLNSFFCRWGNQDPQRGSDYYLGHCTGKNQCAWNLHCWTCLQSPGDFHQGGQHLREFSRPLTGPGSSGDHQLWLQRAPGRRGGGSRRQPQLLCWGNSSWFLKGGDTVLFPARCALSLCLALKNDWTLLSLQSPSRGFFSLTTKGNSCPIPAVTQL